VCGEVVGDKRVDRNDIVVGTLVEPFRPAG